MKFSEIALHSSTKCDILYIMLACARTCMRACVCVCVHVLHLKVPLLQSGGHGQYSCEYLARIQESVCV